MQALSSSRLRPCDPGRGRGDDRVLIEQCLAGVQSAWDGLVERYARLVYSIARRTGLSESDADDVLQDVFTCLFRRLHTVRAHERLASWLATTARRESWKAAGRAERNRRPCRTGVTDETPDVDELHLWERRQVVQEALSELGGREAELLRASFLTHGNAGYKALAARFDLPLGSIGPTRMRCLRKLEAILRRRGFDG